MKERTEVKATPLETCNTSHLHGKKVRDVYTQTYMAQETTFSNQTGQFPIQSLCSNKYIMVMVEIISNAILVEPMKNRKDDKMIRAYNALLLQLKRAGIVPKKHVLDNEVSENMKNHIHDTCKLDMELVPPGCHRCKAAYKQLQSPLPQHLSWCSQRLSTKPLGLAAPTN